MRDTEKGGFEYGVSSVDPEKSQRAAYVDDDGAVAGESFEIGQGWYAKAQRLAGKLKIEQRGIERVPEDERTDTSMLNVSTMWLSANMVVSSFAIGVLGNSIFYLGFVDSILIILFFNLLGILPVSFYSAFGPAFGLRQMPLTRLWFGWWPAKLTAVFNTLACLGWSAVNVIVGAQLLNAVNSDVPGWAGILIIAFCTFVVTLFGYKVVHLYQFYSWIPSFIVFMIVLGQFAHSGDFQNLSWGSGKAEVGSVLSFGSVIFGFATGWSTYAADYTVYQPSTTSKQKVFWWTWAGLIIPLLFTEMLGAAVVTATGTYGAELPEDPSAPVNVYLRGYHDSGIGGLLGATLFPDLGDFGRFCVVILALSIIANNCPNIYSVSLTAQSLGRWTQAVPRFIWTAVGTGIYIAVGIPGYSHFESYLENFMNFIGYWLAIYSGIALTDHFVFKRGFSGYKPETYDRPSELPIGLASFSAFCLGIVGMVMGMSQVWFIGPIARHVGFYNPAEGGFGGDIGFELAFGFAMVTYLALRPLELSFFGR